MLFTRLVNTRGRLVHQQHVWTSNQRKANQPALKLSGGQFQRGLIGFSLIGSPNVLLMDEPTASVDEPGEEHIYELINRLQTEHNLASIMVSHDLSFVFRYATKVLCLNRQKVCFGSPMDALTPEMLAKLYGEAVGVYRHDHHDHTGSQNPNQV